MLKTKENVCVPPHSPSSLCYSRVAATLMTLPTSTTATEVCQAPVPHPAQNSAIKWKFSEVCCRCHIRNGRHVACAELTWHLPLLVFPQLWLGRCQPPWSWRSRNRTKMRCTTTSRKASLMMRVIEIWGHPEQAHGQGITTRYRKCIRAEQLIDSKLLVKTCLAYFQTLDFIFKMIGKPFIFERDARDLIISKGFIFVLIRRLLMLLLN